LIIPKLGIAGAAITSLIAYVYIALRCVFKLRQFIQVKIPWFNWLKTIFAGLVMLAAIFILKNILAKIAALNIYLDAVICAGVGSLLYLLLILALKIINLREIKELAAHIMSR